MKSLPSYARFAVIAGCAVSPLSQTSAQDDLVNSEAVREADKELNKTYQQVMAKLPPISRQVLRNSQRAWLLFEKYNFIAVRSAAAKLGYTHEEAEHFEEAEFESRIEELDSLISGSEVRDWRPNYKSDGVELTKPKLQTLLPKMDGELNVVYQRCLNSLPGDQASRLRDAEQAWVAFRDVSHNLGIGNLYDIISSRTHWLNEFYSGAASEKTGEFTEEKADQSVPDPFERAR
jgi:uncharacterized protein YecT (DUF1311 family)